ncbi:IS5 family transposase [Streptomyces sp. 9-7]|uniref:IS5 family transposase n=1 Tax=Streptomyces siderophoricus TaxID=2802281 RepID=A0ABS1N0A3_9ACTN|nr:IS5 family transposase [Streptomyces sp. 9-7]
MSASASSRSTGVGRRRARSPSRPSGSERGCGRAVGRAAGHGRPSGRPQACHASHGGGVRRPVRRQADRGPQDRDHQRCRAGGRIPREAGPAAGKSEARPDRLHQRPRSSARRRHRLKRGISRPDETGDHALGRSRGGLTTKIHLACDGRGRPLAILLTPGQRHDSICAQPLLERIRVPRLGMGRPRCRPDQVIADKAYSSRGFRTYLRKRGIAHTVPEKTDQRRHRHNRGRRGGRPPGFDGQVYRQRNVVERCFNRLKGFRGIATRYDKTATSYEAAVSLASFLLWARSV